MTVIPDSWDELALIGIQQQGGPTIEFGALTEDITAMDWGEKDIESKPMVSGGNVTRKVPMTQESITLKVYPISTGHPDESTATGVMQHFNPGSSAYGGSDDSTQPLSVNNTLYRRKFQLVLLWATTLPATSTTLPASGVYAKRIIIKNAYLTSVSPMYDDKQYAEEVTFKWSPFQKDGTSNRNHESTDDTAQLSAVTSFT